LPPIGFIRGPSNKPLNLRPIQKVAVIIRDGDPADECLRIGLGFLRTGAKVQTFILGTQTFGRCPHLPAALVRMQQGGAEHYSDNRADAARYGLVYAPLDLMADRLKSADLVISF